jgi:hypothetical protein
VEDDDKQARARSGTPGLAVDGDATASTRPRPGADLGGLETLADINWEALWREASRLQLDPSARDAPAVHWPPIPPPPAPPRIAALAPRITASGCSPREYEVVLESVREWVIAATTLAIANAWDCGRLAFSTHDRPPFEAEVLGIAGRRTGLASARVLEALPLLEQAGEALLSTRLALADRLTPLEVVCVEHGISRSGQVILMFITAPALWGEVARLYGILSNDSARPVCDETLLRQLLDTMIHRDELTHELDPSSPLLRQGLVRVERGRRPFQELVPEPVIVKLISGASANTDVEPGTTLVPATVSVEQFMAPRSVIDRALTELAAAPGGLGRVVVRGRRGSGRRTLLATLAHRAGRTLSVIDVALLFRERRIGELADILRRAHLRGCLPCLDGLDIIPSEDVSTRSAVRELLTAHGGPLVVRLSRHASPPLAPGYVMIELPTLTVAERADQWRTLAGETGMELEKPDELAARFTVGPGTVRTVVAAVARSTPSPADVAPTIDAALRQHCETRLGDVATRVTRLATWSQVVLPAEIQDSIAELIARVRHRGMVYDTWGFDHVMSTSRGLTALFEGGPGTGKTLVASALANELGLDLYRVDLARVVSKWVGETEKNLAEVFDAAEEGHALILFDEADSLFARRTEVRTSTDRYANLEVNYLLQRLDSFEGVAVLTSNLGTSIDPAFKRRLTCRLTFPFPDQDARERLWQIHLPAQMPRAGTLDLAGLARRYQMSGGYIRNAAVRAAFLAAQDQAPLSQFHLERAVRAEFREGGKHIDSGLLE